MDYQVKINVMALADTFLNNFKDKLVNVSELVIQKVRDNNVIFEDVVDKDSFPSKLCDVFNNGVSDSDEIRIMYIECNIKNYLTEIKIFK